MKKLIYLSLSLMVAVSTLPSCNKKLKEDIKDLDKQVSDLQAKNTELENKNSALEGTLNNVNGPLETGNPITWTFSGMDGTTSISKSYSVKLLLDAKSSEQYIYQTSTGIWELYVYKAEDFDYDDYAYFDIYVNESDNAFASGYTNYIWGEHYEDYDSGTNIYANVTTGSYGTLTANSISFNKTTGDVSVDLNWSNPGYTFGTGTESGTMKWSGKCFIYN